MVAIVDPDTDAAASLARRGTGVAWYADLDTCLRAVTAHVVHVCTPPETHPAIVRNALECSCHALVEKPLVRSRSDLEVIRGAAAAAALHVVPVHQFPFQRGVRDIQSSREALGDLLSVSYRTSSAGGLGWEWAERRDLLADILPHAASLFWSFAPGFDAAQLKVEVAGEEAWVEGWSEGIRLEAFVTLRGRPPRNELEVVGTRSSALADLFHGFAVSDRGSVSGWGKATRPLALSARLFGASAANGVGRLLRRELGYPGLRDLVREFYSALERGGQPPISAGELLAATTLVEMARLRA